MRLPAADVPLDVSNWMLRDEAFHIQASPAAARLFERSCKHFPRQKLNAGLVSSAVVFLR